MNRGRRRVHSSLRESELREAGLRVPAVMACLTVRPLGRLEVSEEPLELGLPVERQADATEVLRLDEPLPRPPRLLEGVRPGAAELEDLGAMDETAAGERHDVRLALAPLRQHRRPLLRTARLEHFLAGEDDAAVHDSRRHRRQVASHRGEHRLVEDGEPLGHPARLDQHEPCA